MEIIFDRRNSAFFNCPGEDNTPDKMIARKETTLLKLAEFVGAEKIEYKDLGKGEQYLLTKNGKILSLKISSTPFDGGWMNIEIEPNNIT